MEIKTNQRLVAAILIGVWLLVVGWQTEEHLRVVEAARSDLRGSSREIARTLGAVTRALQFRGAIFQERLEPVLNELVKVHTNALVKSGGLLSVGLLNTEGEPVVTAGDARLLTREALAEREQWTRDHVTFLLPVEGANVNPEGGPNNATVVLPAFRNFTNNPGRNRDFPRREMRPGDAIPHDPASFVATNAPSATNFPPPPTNATGELEPPLPPPDEGRHPAEAGDRNRGGHRPPWMRWISEEEFKALTAKRELHGLVLVMSTDNYRAVCVRDLWLRCIIVFFAGISALGISVAWRNMSKTADLQIRLVRASELNSHLKELNLAAAGLAHETRNPLNIIRGQAQMITRLPAISPEVLEKSQTIVTETDKVTAQLTEFINYSRPREVRRTKIDLTAATREVIHTLNFDIDEKHLRVDTSGEILLVEADEQLLRQVLFNLLLNAIQAAEEGGEIKFHTQRTSSVEAALEIRDNGPGVPPEQRQEIFKPYFTTHQQGTGLGLAVVQQIVLAHGWEITCLGHEPRGAIFRITHLKMAA
jgi:signal transduction histidine kinase